MKLYDEIRAKALCCSIAEASVEEIDQLSILQATLLAMRRAVMGLRLKPAMVLVDGNRLRCWMFRRAIVRSDALVRPSRQPPSSPKVHRDPLVRRCMQVPQYGFADHRDTARPYIAATLRSTVPAFHHRRSFAPVAQNLRAGSDRALKISLRLVRHRHPFPR